MSNYSSSRIKVRRPPMVVSLAQLAGGGLIMLLGIASLPVNYRIAIDFYNYMQGLVNSSSMPDIEGIISALYTLALLIYALVYIPTIFNIFVKGLRLAISGFREIVVPWMPANLPSDFRDYNEVVSGFKTRALGIYQPLNAFISGLLGPNSMFISPARKVVFEDNLSKLRGRLTTIIFTGLIFGCLFLSFGFIVSNSDSEIAQEIISEFGYETWNMLTNPEMRKSLTTPLVFLIIAQIALSGVEFVASFLLVPRGQPDTNSSEGSKHFRGFGHPSQLFSRLPDLSQPLKFEEFENRVYTNWNEASTRSVGDVGEFGGYLVIEQQPQPYETVGDLSAYLLLGFGWLINIIGYYIVLFQVLPTQIKNLNIIGPRSFPLAPIFVIFMSALALTLIRNGERLLKHGRILLEACRFISLGIMIELIGNLSRADVRVGKAMNDSIESSNVVVRSDFTARFWAAELMSEVPKLDSPRELLALNRTELSQQWINFFSTEIEKLREEGVKPIGVDLGAPELEEIVRANVGVSAMRSGAVERAKLEAPELSDNVPLFSPSTRQEIGPGITADPKALPATPDAASGEYKECPDCAEFIRSKARKCRFCGYLFD